MRFLAIKAGLERPRLALHIAVAAERAGYSTVLVDMDPQGTLEAWGDWRKEEPPIVVSAKTPTLAKTLERAATHGADLAVIDTPPVAEAEARTAAKTADLVLVPCRPNAFDLHSIRMTTDLTRFAAKPAYVVFNAGPISAARMYAETAELVTDMGMQVAPIRLCDRAAYAMSPEAGSRRRKLSQPARPPKRSKSYGRGYVGRLTCRHVRVCTRGQR